jgi:hypothetical protein
MGEIVPFKKGEQNKTVADVIQELVDNGVTELVVMGYDKDDKEFFTATIEDGGDIAWLILRLQNKLLLGL